MKTKEYKLVLSIIVIALMAGLIYVIWNSNQIEEEGEAGNQESQEEILFDLYSMTDERLDAYNNAIQSGGVPQDGIPAVDNPIYQSIADADDLMDNQDVIFIVEAEEGIFLYPQRILVWHEIVNEEFDGEKVSITYCPLTGSAIGYKGNFEGIETDFGVSGQLINSNLVMYDRETESYFPQILGTAVDGELKGQRLEEFPVLWSTWGRVKDYYDDAHVLSEGTGFIRDYDSDPYGSYIENQGYYFDNALIFPAMFENNQFQRMDVMIAGRVDDQPFAIPKVLLAEEKTVQLSIGEETLTAHYDEALDTARVVIENGEEETFVNSFDVMWFAWYAFFPETMIYE